MTCRQIDALLDEGRNRPASALPRAAADHLSACQRCRGLFELLEGPSTQFSLPPAVGAGIEKMVLRSLQPVSPMPSHWVFLLSFLGVFAVGILLGSTLVGAGGLQRMAAPPFLALSAILLAGGVLLSCSLSRQLTPGARHQMTPLLLAPLILAAFVVVAAVGLPWRWSSRFWVWGPACAGFGLLWSLLAALPLVWLARRGAVLRPAAAGASAGLLAGLVGAAVIHLGCLNVTAPHAALWHAAVPLTAALAGLLLGSHSRRRA